MQIVDQTVVSIDYTLTNPDGQVLDSSKGRGPLTYLHGMGNIIPGLERALAGKSVGENVSVTIPPEEAYGPRDEALVVQVPREALSQLPSVEVGMQLQASNGQETRIVTVTKVEAESVTVDANPPLAGQTLCFDVAVVQIRQATAEELEHGHVHGPGGHHH